MNDELGRKLARAEGREREDELSSITLLARHQQSLEQSMADAIAEVVTWGSGLTVTRTSHNVVTLAKQREGQALEVQVIVKCGTAHEVRDDVWDAIMDHMDMVSATQLANAAMERLGFPTPDGGWPK
jgi:hypothetical protein